MRRERGGLGISIVGELWILDDVKIRFMESSLRVTSSEVISTL